MGIEAAIAAALVSAGASAAAAAAISAFVVNTVVSIALGALASALAPKPKKPNQNLSGGFAAKAAGVTQNIKQPITARRILYGEARIGGALTFIETTDADKYMHLIITLCDHEVEHIGEIQFNGVSIPEDALDGSGNVTTGDYADKARIKKYLGSSTQTADADLVSETSATSDFRGRGVAYLYVRLEFDRDVYPSSVPTITAWVKGKKILDPRDSVTRWTPNGALFAYDYLTEPLDSLTPGVGIDTGDIDETYLNASANICDEIVTTADLTDNIGSADASTDILTLTGVNGKLQYQTGDRVKVTGGSLPGGLISTTTNLFDYSEDFDGNWTTQRGSSTADQIANPLDGAVTVDLFTESTDTGVHTFYDDVTTDPELTHTFSVYLKANGRDKLRVDIRDRNDQGNRVNVEVDLALGTITSTTPSGNAVYDSSEIHNLGDGWFRVSVTGICNNVPGTTIRSVIHAMNASGSVNYTGDGSSGFYAWGAQLEQYDEVTDYVQSAGSQGSQATNYYVIPYQRKTSVRIKLAASLEDALAGNAIDITGSGTGTITKTGEPRFYGGGIVETSEQTKEILEDLLTTCGGSAIFVGGEWKIKAASYHTPVYSFDEDHIISPITVRTKVSRRERFNLIKGVYVSPLNDGEPADYPVIENSTYQTNDGQTLPIDFDLSFTQRPHTAQRLAKIKLEKHRQELFFEATFSLHAMQVQPGDVVNISNDRMGWSNKVFEVITWGLQSAESNGVPVYSVKMALQETASAVYDWNSGEETAADPAPDTNLPNPLSVDPPTGLAVIPREVRTAAGDLTYEFDITWTQPADIFVINGGKYEVEFKKSSESDWKSSYDAKDTDEIITVKQIDPGVNYDTRVRSINQLGVRSQWQSLFGFNVSSPSGATIKIDDGLITGSVVETVDEGLITDGDTTDNDEGTIV